MESCWSDTKEQPSETMQKGRTEEQQNEAATNEENASDNGGNACNWSSGADVTTGERESEDSHASMSRIGDEHFLRQGFVLKMSWIWTRPRNNAVPCEQPPEQKKLHDATPSSEAAVGTDRLHGIWTSRAYQAEAARV